MKKILLLLVLLFILVSCWNNLGQEETWLDPAGLEQLKSLQN